MLKLVDMIAHRQGIGNLLAEGVRRAAEVIGGDARSLALHVKGQELPMHDPRAKRVLAWAMPSPTRGRSCHGLPGSMIANPNSVSFRAALRSHHRGVALARSGRKKVLYYSWLENWNSMGRVLGLCYFGPAPRSFIQADEVVSAVRASTGWS